MIGDMLRKVRETVERYQMVKPGESVIVAVSGGPDSVALLTALNDLAPEMGLTLVVAHVNHALRPEADGEADFVRHLAGTMGWPCESVRIDVGAFSRLLKTSLEDAARTARYDFFRRTAERRGATKIALGHHSGDQAETVLMNLIRGSGTDGLKGMLPVREDLYIRPLLFVSRGEILDDLKKRGLTFVLDQSNETDDFLRNRIRRRLLPTLREAFNPLIDDGLCRLAEIIRQDDDFMETLVDQHLATWRIRVSEETVALSVPDVASLHDALQNRIIKRILEGFCPEGKGIAFAHVTAVKNIFHSRHPACSLNLPYGVFVRREYGRVMISPHGASGVTAAPDYAYPVSVPGEVMIPETGMRVRLSLRSEIPGAFRDGFMDSAMAWMDYGRIQPPLTVRNFRPGDRMQGLGMAGSKKLKDIFIDDKIPREERRRVPLLVDARSILWIGGRRLSHRVRISDQTKQILTAEII